MTGRQGPFRIVESDLTPDVDAPREPPRRRFECPHYQTCLDVAAALSWDSFTCRGCCEQVNSSLFWRANNAFKRDDIARVLCSLPRISAMRSDSPENKISFAEPPPSHQIQKNSSIGSDSQSTENKTVNSKTSSPTRLRLCP